MSCEIIIRRAREGDAVQRAELIQMGLLSYQWDSFIYFLFQELTLECVLLGSAVLFIFCGAAPAGCALLLPAAAALVAAAVAVAHRALASAHAQRMRGEMFGLVAEARGPLRLGAPPGPVPIYTELQHCPPTQHDVHSKVVGTLSVSAYRAPGELALDHEVGWLHALAVHTQWQCRGTYDRRLVGAALTLQLARLGLDLPHA
ncbi:PREDICTED: uncharacterized protein LOC106116297 [Papilio xuthus]|uniref:Uncharacterized protein LOC106116297 n=1 Tax=Papilio xuthus TaxID=66420 RepID=A0AAJ7E725_PAPXU|nr:PREDICTED: uncharacterized protein LOC106116297 [Papilio xuthus]